MKFDGTDNCPLCGLSLKRVYDKEQEIITYECEIRSVTKPNREHYSFDYYSNVEDLPKYEEYIFLEKYFIKNEIDNNLSLIYSADLMKHLLTVPMLAIISEKELTNKIDKIILFK